MTQPSLDPVSLAVALAATIVGKEMAPYVGAYSVILFGWFGGMLIGLVRREPSEDRWRTLAFVAITFIVTIGSTWVAAVWLAAKVSIESTYLLFPVAVVIPAVGEDWIKIIKWALRLWKGRIDKGQQP